MTPNIQKMTKRKLKFLLHSLQDFKCMFDHFVETRRYRINLILTHLSQFPISIPPENVLKR